VQNPGSASTASLNRRVVFEIEGLDRLWDHGELVFWDVHDPAKTIIVSLDHERYKKLIIEVADPAAVIMQLRQSIAHRTP
jgi:hypothetical protein